MEENTQKEILEELKKLTRLSGISLTNGLASGEKIEVLSKAGLAPKEIGEILGVTPNLVRVTLFKSRSRDKAKRKTSGSTARKK